MKHWIRFAKFEQYQGVPENARAVYERAVEYFGVENMAEELMFAFAQFEENQKECVFPRSPLLDSKKSTSVLYRPPTQRYEQSCMLACQLVAECAPCTMRVAGGRCP